MDSKNSEQSSVQTPTNGHADRVDFGANESRDEPLKVDLPTPDAKVLGGFATVNELDEWSEAVARSDPRVSQLLEEGERLIGSIARKKSGLESKERSLKVELDATPRRIDVPIVKDKHGLPEPVLWLGRGKLVTLAVLLAVAWAATTLCMEFSFDLGIAKSSTIAIFQNIDSAGGLVFAMSFGAFGCFTYWMMAQIHNWHWTHIRVSGWAAIASIALLGIGTVGLGLSHMEGGFIGWLIVLMLPLGAFVLVGSAMAGEAMFGWIGKLLFPTREEDNGLHPKREESLAEVWDDLDDVNETTGKGIRMKERAYSIIKNFQGRCRSYWESCRDARALGDKVREARLKVGIAKLHEKSAKEAFQERNFEEA